MEIEKSSLWFEVQKIMRDGAKPVAYYWQSVICAKGKDYPVIKTLSVDIKKDFEKAAGSDIQLQVQIPLGLYIKVIFPERNNLEITLRKEKLFEVGNSVDRDADLESDSFKAVPILDEKEAQLLATNLQQYDQYSLDLKDILTVTFQLLDKSFDYLKTVTVGNQFRKTTGEEVIKAVLMNESSKARIQGARSISGVDMVAANNTEEREHVVIPQGTKLTEVAKYIQNECGGIYNSGLGCFLNDDMWYVYPLYNTERFYEAKRTITLIKVPKTKLMGVERTYRMQGDSIFVIGTSESSFTDDAQTQFMNEGNGAMFADARVFMGNKDLVKTQDNKTVMDRSKVNHEFVVERKDDKQDNVQLGGRSITANPFREYTAINSRNGGILNFIWENSKPDLLYPGMMVKFIYLDHDVIKELRGVLLYEHAYVQLRGKGADARQHTTTTYMAVFVNEVKQEG